MRSRRRRLQRQKGVALVELIIATSILSIVGMTLLLGLTTSITTTNNVSRGRAAMDAAQSQMESIKLADWSVNGTAYQPLASDDLPTGVNQADITITVQRPDGSPCIGNETLQLIIVQVDYADGKKVTLEGYKSDRLF